MFKLVLLAAWATLGRAGIVQQAAISSPAVAAPIATGFRITGPITGYSPPLATPAGRIVPKPLEARIAHIPAPLAAAPVAKQLVSEDYDPNPQYTYSYDVQDTITGDSKNQIETRDGDVVQGSYSLTDPDGTRRTVEYTADPINGFNAVVRREPIAAAAAPIATLPAIAKVAAPIITKVSGPTYARIQTPLAYSSITPAPLLLSKTIIH